MTIRCTWPLTLTCVFVLSLSRFPADGAASDATDNLGPVRFKSGLPGATLSPEEIKRKGEKLLDELKALKFKIIHESYRDGNWELAIMNADGSNSVNLTRTATVHELYPKASPDGKKVAFLADVFEGEQRVRNVYYMNVDGAKRVKVGQNGRQPFWSPDGKRIGFSTGQTPINVRTEAHNQGLYFYNIETGQYSEHPHNNIAGLVNPSWSCDGRWIITSAMADHYGTGKRATGFVHSIVAIEAAKPKIVELRRSNFTAPKAVQCRPDISPDGRRIAWGIETGPDNANWIEVGDIDLAQSEPQVTNRRYIVGTPFPLQTYFVDWSPDGKYIVYSEGGRGTRMGPASIFVGSKAPGWDIWVVKPSEPEVVVRLTFDGQSNKEPDWVFVE